MRQMTPETIGCIYCGKVSATCSIATITARFRRRLSGPYQLILICGSSSDCCGQWNRTVDTITIIITLEAYQCYMVAYCSRHSISRYEWDLHRYPLLYPLCASIRSYCWPSYYEPGELESRVNRYPTHSRVLCSGVDQYNVRGKHCWLVNFKLISLRECDNGQIWFGWGWGVLIESSIMTMMYTKTSARLIQYNSSPMASQ